MKHLTSARNPLLRHARALRERKTRLQHGQFLIEGEREAERAMLAGYRLRSVIVAEGRPQPRWVPQETEVSTAPLALLRKIVLRDSSAACAAIADLPAPAAPPSKLNYGRILAAERLEKPGNLGALCRTGDALGVDSIVMVGETVDPFSPNAIRASLGTSLTLRLLTLTCAQLRTLAADLGALVIGAALDGEPIDQCTQFGEQPSVLLLGSEAHGLSDEARQICDRLICVPMGGIGDSLNVSVAAGIVLFECARRQAQSRR